MPRVAMNFNKSCFWYRWKCQNHYSAYACPLYPRSQAQTQALSLCRGGTSSNLGVRAHAGAQRGREKGRERERESSGYFHSSNGLRSNKCPEHPGCLSSTTRYNLKSRPRRLSYQVGVSSVGDDVSGTRRSERGQMDHQEITDTLTDHAESLRYWNDLIGRVERPTARLMLPRIDRDNLTGVDTSLKGVSTSKNSLYQFLVSVKQQHPTKVVLVRVGEFYETWGFDAMLLVEHCGLNPMGNRLPRAGCPKVNIQRTLDDLTAIGLRCVVCEEAPMPYSYGVRSKRKTRFVSQVVTPHSPVYVYNLSGNHTVSPEFAFQMPPVVGIAQRKQDAFTVMLMDVDLRQITAYHDVNEEIAAHIISSNGFSPPVYCHESYLTSVSDSKSNSKSLDGQKIYSIIQDSFKVRVKGEPFTFQFIESVKKDLDLASDTEFTFPGEGEKKGNGSAIRPLPLYNMTAKSIGLTLLGSSSSSNTPSLVSSLLPSDAPAPCKHFMVRYLMHPPPGNVSQAVQRSLSRISEATQVLPVLPILPAHKVAKMIHSREANHSMFVDLLAMVRGIQQIFGSQELEGALFPLTEVAALNTGRKFKTSEIQEVCEIVIEEITSCINCTHLLEESSWDEFGEDQDEDQDSPADVASVSVSTATAAAADFMGSGDKAFESLLFANEKSMRVVLESCVGDQLSNVEAARSKLRQAIQKDLEPALESLSKKETATSWSKLRSPPRISFDAINNSLAIRGVSASSTGSSKEWTKEFGLINPKDRNGSRLADRHSSTQVEEALNEYRYECHELDLAVRDALKELAARISPYVTQIVYLSHFSLVSKSFWLHVAEAKRRGWALPTLLPPSTSESERFLKVDDFWPFWMDAKKDPLLVKNSVDMGKLALLTGPNMAGKSTVIRAICSVSLLANCGMYAPCASTSVVPYFDAYILRSAESADSPEDGLSTFAVEMSDARAIIRDTTRESLVFVDELCKGTEAKAGACIAASVAEYLSKIGALGLFATHLDLVSLPGNVLEDDMDFLKMEVEKMNETNGGGGGGSNRGGRATWKIVSGVSKESFAYKVAEQCGVPDEIVQRAIALDERLKKEEKEEEEGFLGAETGEEEERVTEIEMTSAPAASPAASPPIVSLDAALSVVCSIVSAQEDGEPTVTKLKPGQIPPPATMGHSCVYVLLCKGGSYYVGETDDIVRRWREHRQNYKRDLREFAFVLLPKSYNNKSLAREVETKTIRRLEQLGFKLENVNY